MKKMMVLLLFSLGIAQLQCKDESLDSEENNNSSSSEWNNLVEKLSVTQEERDKLLEIVQGLQREVQDLKKNNQDLAREKAESEKAKLAAQDKYKQIFDNKNSFNLEKAYRLFLRAKQDNDLSEFMSRYEREELQQLMEFSIQNNDSESSRIFIQELKMVDARGKGVLARLANAWSYYPYAACVAVGFGLAFAKTPLATVFGTAGNLLGYTTK